MEEAGAANAVQTAPATTTDPMACRLEASSNWLGRSMKTCLPQVTLDCRSKTWAPATWSAALTVQRSSSPSATTVEKLKVTQMVHQRRTVLRRRSLQGPDIEEDQSATPPIVANTDVDDKMGQLALAPVTHLDFEGVKNTYVVEISDPDTEVDLSIYRVTITVMDVNEAPTAPSELKGLPPVLNTAPEFAATSTTFSVDENTAENTAAGMVVGTVTATDADRGDQDTLVYTLGGADAGSFAIDSASGEITTAAMLDYEMQDSYMVMVTATDDDEATDMIYVTIMVNDLGLDNAYDMNEDGTISRDEVIEAIRDFLLNSTIDREQVIEVIRLYLTS